MKEIASSAKKELSEKGSFGDLKLRVDFDYREFVSYGDVSYKKNLLFASGDVDIYLICWRAGQKSKIHDHPDKGCVMIVLEGVLLETQFVMEGVNLVLHKKNILTVGESNYNYGSTVLHQIEPLCDTVSLHVYHTKYTPKYY